MRKIALGMCIAAVIAVFALPVEAATRVRENTVWYRLHLGTGVPENPVSAATVQEFIDTTITPAFPDGLTVTEARGQWRSPEFGLLREKTFVIDIQCEDTDANWNKIKKAAEAYVNRNKNSRASFFIKRIQGVVTTLIY